MGDEYGYFVAANHLLSTGELVLDPLWPPLFPWFLAGIFQLGGEAQQVLAIVQTGLLAIAAVSLGVVVRTVLDSPRSGRWAAWMMMGYPSLAAFAYYAWPEILYLAAFLSACALLVRLPENYLAAATAGLLLGIALLCKLVLWPFLPLVTLPLLARRSRQARNAAALVLVIASSLVVLASPLLRPQGPATRADTNIAFNIHLGLLDTSQRTFVDSIAGRHYKEYVDSAEDIDERTQILWSKIRDLLIASDPLAIARGQATKQYARLFDPESFFTAQLPGGALESTPSGYRDIPKPVGTIFRAITWASYFGLLALAIIGIGLRPWRQGDRVQRAWIAVFGAFLAYNLAIFFLLHVVSRYRIAMLPVLFLFAAAALDRLLPSDNSEADRDAASLESPQAQPKLS